MRGCGSARTRLRDSGMSWRRGRSTDMRTLLFLMLTVAAVAADDQIRPEPNRGGAIDLAAHDPKVALARLKPAAGYDVSLFASEKEFPDLAKPLAMTFDPRGRLWVLTSPTYPH